MVVSSDAFGNISTVDLKNLLFKEKMQEIEDDVPPFGVITDSGTTKSEHQKMYDDIKAWMDL